MKFADELLVDAELCPREDASDNVTVVPGGHQSEFQRRSIAPLSQNYFSVR